MARTAALDCSNISLVNAETRRSEQEGSTMSNYRWRIGRRVIGSGRSPTRRSARPDDRSQRDRPVSCRQLPPLSLSFLSIIYSPTYACVVFWKTNFEIYLEHLDRNYWALAFVCFSFFFFYFSFLVTCAKLSWLGDSLTVSCRNS